MKRKTLWYVLLIIIIICIAIAWYHNATQIITASYIAPTVPPVDGTSGGGGVPQNNTSVSPSVTITQNSGSSSNIIPTAPIISPTQDSSSFVTPTLTPVISMPTNVH